MKMYLNDDRRRFPRAKRTVCAWISLRDNATEYGTLTVDLSSDGASFCALSTIEVGERVLLSLQMRSVSIECKARVVWTSVRSDGLHHFGVRFLDLSTTERRVIADFVARSAILSAAV